MRTKCFEIDEEGHLHSVEYASAMERWRAGGGPLWILIDSPEREDRERVLGDVGLDQEVVNELLESGHAARLLPLGEGLFFEYPERISGEPPELKSISFVCLDRLVITLHGIPLGESWGSVEGVLSRLVLPERSTSELGCALLVEGSIELRHRSSELRQTTVALSRRLDANPGALDLSEILDLKREIVDLDAVSEERGAIMEQLELLKRPFFDLTPFADQFRIALGNTAATARRLDRLARRARDLQHQYDAHQQEKTNRRLSRLTIISAIFLPLTLIAGIYGMNFEVIPGLRHPFGLPIVLGGMALAALGMMWWFRARGWMD